MSGITTHVLDTSRGKPAADIPVTLARLDESGLVADTFHGVTDADGRVANLLGATPLAAGDFRLSFNLTAYAEQHFAASFYPQVDITFTVSDASQHFHVPLLLSPFGYSTYRGS
ncbi:hydroxyisourate hydrolase [Aeoliella sp. ICT_H6.2]|uniref:5-hydroxyisourate hydrolase n=1 Tax=Aeoliella straminimaris TaxID=2954799 RepID=A0A9X2FCB2_9BACT|nr:hydroxyisourate hydrolase [Aeoliella straminimaris]MCO6046340.1 hydroxyisourate hydrolase [Aeoliella straminimaris]